MLVIGGHDVDARLDLMTYLSTEFALAAAGSERTLGPRFEELGFGFSPFGMARAVSPIADLRSFVALVRICRRVRPDIVHAFATKPAVWGRLAARVAGVPVIVGTVPGLGSLYSGGGWTKRLVRAIYQRLQALASSVSSATVFQNQRDRDQMIELGVVPEDRAFLIPGSGVRTDVIGPGRVARAEVAAFREGIGALEGDAVVTMVARVIRPKGVLEYAAAARTLSETNPGVRFVLVGPNDRESVDRLTPAEMDDVEASVRYLGPRDDVVTILAATDVFVLPSYYREGMPRVLLEAGSMAVPSVAARVPGSEDVIEDGETGLLVEPRDSEDLTAAIRALLDDEPLRRRLGEGARRRIVKHFDAKVVADLTAGLYRQLLSAVGRGTNLPVGGFDNSVNEGRSADFDPERTKSQ